MSPEIIQGMIYASMSAGIVGSLYLSERHTSGWIFGILSSVGYLIYGFAEGIPSFAVVNAVSILVAIYGIHNWHLRGHKSRAARRKKQR